MRYAEAGFAFFLIFIPFFLGFLHGRLKRGAKKEIYLLYYIFIGVGIQGLITGAVQIFYPQFVSDYVQWPVSSFLFELGLANVSYGILGICAPWLSQGWQRAAAIGYGMFLLLTGAGHLFDMSQQGMNPGNGGAFLYSDLLIPIILWSLLI